MDVFNVLAEPRRRQVIEILANRGHLNATQISDEFDVTPQAISQHLRLLTEHDIIRMEKRAQQRIYAFNPKSLFEIKKWDADMTEMWNNRFDRLDKALKEDGLKREGKAL